MRHFLLSLLVILYAFPVLAVEDIKSFDSKVTIHNDGHLTVEEIITVNSEGRAIKRGIFRDFPTEYLGPNKERKNVSFKVLSVKRNGRAETYRVEKIRHGQRIRIGDKDRLLNRGEYVYSIIYQTDRQIGFFEDADELYWNVTGNDWAFPIRKATVTIHLPPGADLINADFYTGLRGETSKDAKIISESAGSISFASTRSYNRGEGLTVVVSWPKGFVVEPGLLDDVQFLLRDNIHIAVGFGGFILTFFYFYLAWSFFGKDPKKGPEVPRYEPPRNFSAAATRYVQYMGFDHQMLSTVIVSLAVKGAIKIVEDGDYYIELADRDAKGLTKGEFAVLRKFFPRGETKAIRVHRDNYRTFEDAKSVLETAILSEYAGHYFETNISWTSLGMFLGFLTVVLTVSLGPIPLPLMASALTVGGVFIALWIGLSRAPQFMAKLLAVFDGKGMSLKFKVGVTTLAILIVSASSVFVLQSKLGLFVSVISTATLLLCAVFHYLLKAPTQLGRQIMDEIEGFKLFLSLTEKDRWDILHPRELTPELFEKYLPYALALDVSHDWSEKFADTLDNTSYQPKWYSGPGYFSIMHIERGLSHGFTNAMAVASIPPRSHTSSSGFGGGFSGGGGGGGGGGGW